MMLAIGIMSCNQTSTAQGLSATEFQKKLQETTSYNLLDVRTPQEFKISHIEGAKNINIYDSDFKEKVDQLDKETPVFVYCKSGGRSSNARRILESKGYQVYELNGGMLKWESQHLPVKAGNVKAAAPAYDLKSYQQIADTTPLLLVDFMAEWCGPCKLMAPAIEELKKENPGLTVLKIDVDRNKELSQHFRVSSIPMVKIYANGDLVFDEIGYRNKDQLYEVLKPHL